MHHSTRLGPPQGHPVRRLTASHELTYVAMVTSNRNENLARDQITVLNSVLAETHAVVCIIICVNIYNNNLTPEFI